MRIVRGDPKSVDITSMPTLVVAYSKQLVILNPIRSDSCTHHAHPNCTLLRVASRIPISTCLGCQAYIFTHNMIRFYTHLLRRSSSCSSKAFDTYIVVAITPYFCTILAPFIVGGRYTLHISKNTNEDGGYWLLATMCLAYFGHDLGDTCGV